MIKNSSRQVVTECIGKGRCSVVDYKSTTEHRPFPIPSTTAYPELFFAKLFPAIFSISSLCLVSGLFLLLLSLYGHQSVILLVHLLSFILAMCPAHLHFCFLVSKVYVLPKHCWNQKRLNTRWRDEIEKFAGKTWQRIAQNRQLWKELGKVDLQGLMRIKMMIMMKLSKSSCRYKIDVFY